MRASWLIVRSGQWCINHTGSQRARERRAQSERPRQSDTRPAWIAVWKWQGMDIYSLECASISTHAGGGGWLPRAIVSPLCDCVATGHRIVSVRCVR